MNKTGTIVLPTLSAAMLWSGELTGQFSDGMWENAAPHDHWRFWSGLSVAVIKDCNPHVRAIDWAHRPMKTSYNIAGLYNIVGQRMLALGRMGKALEGRNLTVNLEAQGGALRSACEFMREMSYRDWLDIKTSGAKFSPHSWINTYMDAVSLEVGAAFYAADYTMRELRRDVASIKAAMKNVTQ